MIFSPHILPYSPPVRKLYVGIFEITGLAHYTLYLSTKDVILFRIKPRGNILEFSQTMRKEYLVNRGVVKPLCLFALAAMSAMANEPIRWTGGEWDDTGAPKGALLTDNPGWWGRSVFTGVTYEYEEGHKPINPPDRYREDKRLFGRRLLDGRVKGDWHVPVGWNTGSLVAVFDFKRPCVFNEVDLFLGFGLIREHATKLSFSNDKTNWCSIATFTASNRFDRIRLSPAATGRYMRLELSEKGGPIPFTLDEVLAWGEGEVSDKYPEAIEGVPAGGALTLTDRRDGGIEVAPLTKPTLAAAKATAGGAVRTSCGDILLARNETETRYFAVVNASASNQTVRLAPPDFGEGVKSELRIGGLVRVSRPKVKLTPKQILDLMVTDIAAAEGGGDPGKVDVLPFFSPDAKPRPNFARRYLANAAQVMGFPEAVRLMPGEGCVVMLRVTTDGAKPGRREGAFVATTPSSSPAGDDLATVNLSATIADVTLPDVPLWVFAWSPFTSQFPFESETRHENDVARIAELGISSCYGFPLPRTKSARLKARVPRTRHWISGWLGGGLFEGTYCCRWKHYDEKQRARIAADAHKVVEKAKALGLKPEEYFVDTPDEPGHANAELHGELARNIKKAEPTLQVFMNPCFWIGNGFPPPRQMLDDLKPFYNDVVDISCPIRDLVRPGNLLTTNLWTKPRAVNAQYIHPASRAGRSIAWSSFENGMNGFSYYCYYSPRGNAWDIRTWNELHYGYQMVFPLENDVAITPIYETMHEAWEDYRMLAALRNAGKDELLAELLKSYKGATEYADPKNVSNRPNFQSLHDKALAAFKDL